jgi:putative flippase GtrA
VIAHLRQFMRFGIVGCIGLVVDWAVLYTVMYLTGWGPIISRIPAYIAAASANYFAHRRWTFCITDQPVHPQQWAQFLLLNLLGFAVNYGVYAALVTTFDLSGWWLAGAVFAGAVAGMALNFWVNKYFIFAAV